MGHTCFNYTEDIFYNNTAHSTKEQGVFVYPDGNSGVGTLCLEASYFRAYKTG
jgi:ornithine cyclodeaminase/alanine dehydrogenase-like protein (mu-crystallin family)